MCHFPVSLLVSATTVLLLLVASVISAHLNQKSTGAGWDLSGGVPGLICRGCISEGAAAAALCAFQGCLLWAPLLQPICPALHHGEPQPSSHVLQNLHLPLCASPDRESRVPVVMTAPAVGADTM